MSLTYYVVSAESNPPCNDHVGVDFRVLKCDVLSWAMLSVLGCEVRVWRLSQLNYSIIWNSLERDGRMTGVA